MPENISFKNNLNLFLHQHFNWPHRKNPFLIPLSSMRMRTIGVMHSEHFWGRQETRAGVSWLSAGLHPHFPTPVRELGSVTLQYSCYYSGSNLLMSWNEVSPSFSPFPPGCTSLAEGSTPGAGFDPSQSRGCDQGLHPCAHVLLMATISEKFCFTPMKNISSNSPML